jgi:hypothetical protein
MLSIGSITRKPDTEIRCVALSAEGILDRFKHADHFIEYTTEKLLGEPNIHRAYPRRISRNPRTSAVLFLLGNHCGANGFNPCLVLNKRSDKVRQPGDLCCPGGGVSPLFDGLLARIFALPGFPLERWPHWPVWRYRQPAQAGRLALLFATSMRESFEEMRLNPLGVRFIGPLPAQRLVLFEREIFPMAGWVVRQKRFFPNQEVESIVRVPIRNLLNTENYGCYRLFTSTVDSPASPRSFNDYPCYMHRDENGTEMLWGATYRIAAAFLDRVFGFKPPRMETLPMQSGTMDETYLTRRK